MRVRPGLRVLQVIYQDPVTYPPTLNAARLLAQAGAEVVCLGYRRDSDENVALPQSVRIRYLNAHPSLPGILKKIANVSSLRSETRSEIAGFRPDLVIAYDWWGGWGVLPCLGQGSYKVVLHMHDLLNEGASRFSSSDDWMWAQVTRNIQRFDMLVVPEKQRADYLRDRARIFKPARIAANSPPRHRPVRNDLLKRVIAARAGRMPGMLAVVVGNMGLYMEMVRGLAATRSDWHLALIGCGHGPSVKLVVEEARRLGIEDRLHVFPYTNYDTVQSWLPGCDVGIGLYPSSSANVNWQTMGSASVKVQEYMAAGIPSIVCSRQTFSTLAADTGALELLESETPQAMTAALDRLEPGGAHHTRLARAAELAHLDRFNCEFQLQPVLDELGLAGDRKP
jgi:glycosyltransferase involved in cell wall biosynthesis